MGGVCSAYGESRRFWWGNVRERDHLGDTSVDGKIILRRIFREWEVGYGVDRFGSG